MTLLSVLLAEELEMWAERLLEGTKWERTHRHTITKDRKRGHAAVGEKPSDTSSFDETC